jgi:hypothetical protein
VVGFSRTYGGENSDTATAVIQTSDGGYAFAGSTHSFGADYNDAWLVKVDAYGNEQWSRTYGGPGDDYAVALVQTSDGGYALAGWTGPFDGGSDFWLIKTDSSGKMEWSQTYHKYEYNAAHSIVQTSNGGYVLGGESDSPDSKTRGWLIQVDSSGKMLWDHPYAAAVSCVIKTNDGGFALGIDHGLVKLDSSGALQWNQTYGPEVQVGPVLQTSDGYAVAGTATNGLGSFWLGKVDSSGKLLWNQTYGSQSYTSSLVQANDGGYALFGDTNDLHLVAGKQDWWLVKTDSSGKEQWNQTYGGILYEYAGSLLKTNDGGYLMAGSTESFTGPGDFDAWLLKTDANGTMPPGQVGYQDSWNIMASMPTGRWSLGVAAANGKIYALGGITFGEPVGISVNEEYDPATNTWTTKAQMLSGRHSFGIAVYQDKIYVVGGITDNLTNYYVVTGENDVYDVLTDSWTTKSPMPTPASGVTANAVKGKIYVTGGGLMQIYDVADDAWTTKTPPVDLGSYVSTALDNKIYYMTANSTLIYDPETDTWTSGKPNPVGGTAAAAVTGVEAPKKIFVIVYNGLTQVYDPETDSWTTGITMLTQRDNCGFVNVDDLLYAIGGTPALLTPLRANERYTPFGYAGAEPKPTPSSTPTPTETPNQQIIVQTAVTIAIVVAVVLAVGVAVFAFRRRRGKQST